jgi:transposase-like protein/cold shock CspA family protein
MDLISPIFTDETAAREYLENQRWADGVTCPLCGGYEKISKLGGKSMGEGWWHCGDCRKKFTVRVGTLYERSHVPLHKWLLATHLLVSSKKGMSAHQLHRMLGVTYKTAWFMAHRIREGSHETFQMGMGSSPPKRTGAAYYPGRANSHRMVRPRVAIRRINPPTLGRGRSGRPSSNHWHESTLPRLCRKESHTRSNRIRHIISHDKLPVDIFFHKKNFIGDIDTLRLGQAVVFQLLKDKKGKLSAIKVRKK